MAFETAADQSRRAYGAVPGPIDRAWSGGCRRSAGPRALARHHHLFGHHLGGHFERPVRVSASRAGGGAGSPRKARSCTAIRSKAPMSDITRSVLGPALDRPIVGPKRRTLFERLGRAAPAGGSGPVCYGGKGAKVEPAVGPTPNIVAAKPSIRAICGAAARPGWRPRTLPRDAIEKAWPKTLGWVLMEGRGAGPSSRWSPPTLAKGHPRHFGFSCSAGMGMIRARDYNDGFRAGDGRALPARVFRQKETRFKRHPGVPRNPGHPVLPIGAAAHRFARGFLARDTGCCPDGRRRCRARKSKIDGRVRGAETKQGGSPGSP